MRLLSSMEGIWCQDGNTLLSVSCALTEGGEKNKVLHCWRGGDRRRFSSSCLLAMDIKTGSSSVIRCQTWVRLAARGVLQSDDAACTYPRLDRTIARGHKVPKTATRNCISEDVEYVHFQSFAEWNTELITKAPVSFVCKCLMCWR